MAIFTSDDGNFEITALSFNPKGIVWGESTTWSITFKNLTGGKISKIAAWTYINYIGSVAGKVQHTPGQNLIGDAMSSETISYVSVNWAKNAEMTFGGTITFSSPLAVNPPAAFTSRCMPARTGSGSSSYGLYICLDNGNVQSSFTNIYGENHEHFGILDQHYYPVIENFEVERTSDEAEDVKSTIKLALADGLGDEQKARMLTRLADGNGNTVPLYPTQAEMLAGITDSLTAITQTFSKASNYKLILTFGDEYESKSWPVTIPRSFANVHLSGNADGGVCFGGFCKPEKPATFECYYPAVFYDGITVGGGSGGSIELEADTLLFGFMSNGKKDIYLTVPVPYMPSSVTTVTVTSIKGNVRCAGGYGAASGYVEGGTDYTSLVAAVTPCPSIGAVTIKLTRSTAMNGTNNYALTFQVSELKMTIS